MPYLADHPAGIRPLGKPGRLVLVDKHPICSVCGKAVTPAGPDRWQHVPHGRLPPTRSRYLAIESPPPHRYLADLRAFRRRRRLRAGENPYLDLFRLLTAEHALPARRCELASLFSWAIPTEEALAELATHAPLVDCGAGTGYWTALLQARSVDALAYDLVPPGGTVRNAFHRRRKPWVAVSSATSVDAVRAHPERTLLLCWPPYDDDTASYAPLRAYRGDVVAYVGEDAGGATGTVRFHRELALNWQIASVIQLPTWPGLNDRMFVYRRNPMRRSHTLRDRCYECGRYVPTGSVGRCDACFRERPPALALQHGLNRVEYPRLVLDAMPPALRRALEVSPNRIR